MCEEEVILNVRSRNTTNMPKEEDEKGKEKWE